MKKISYLLSSLGAFLCFMATPVMAQYCESSFCDGRFTVGADWIYGQVEQTNMQFGSLVYPATEINSIPTVTSKAIKPNFDYNSGYRVEIGYELPGNGWELGLCYTYLPSSTRSSYAPTAGTVFSPLGLNFPETVVDSLLVDTLNFTTFSTNWSFNINNVDFDIARTLTFGECFNLRPHIGFRATWFSEKFRLTGELVDPIIATPVALSDVLKEKMNGYGVEGGLWANWNIGCGFSLAGHFGGSLLYSEIKSSQGILSTTTSSTGVVTNLLSTLSKNRHHIGTPSLDYFVGLDYVSAFCDTQLGAQLGWEQHVLFDVNRLATHGGNLYIQALTLGAFVAF